MHALHSCESKETGKAKSHHGSLEDDSCVFLCWVLLALQYEWQPQENKLAENLQTCKQEPILALRRQLAMLSGAGKEASICWLQHAEVCRATGHLEAARMASLQALAQNVPGAQIEHARLLWDMQKPDRAIDVVQQVSRFLQVQHMLPSIELKALHSDLSVDQGGLHWSLEHDNLSELGQSIIKSALHCDSGAYSAGNFEKTDPSAHR